MALVIRTQGGADAGLRDKKKFVAKSCKLATGLGGGGDNRCGISIGRARERRIAIQVAQVGDPFPLIFHLAESWRPRQATGDRPDYEGYRPFTQEKRERTGQGGGHRKNAKNNVKLARKDTAAQLSPSEPFKGQRKWEH